MFSKSPKVLVTKSKMVVGLTEQAMLPDNQHANQTQREDNTATATNTVTAMTSNNATSNSTNNRSDITMTFSTPENSNLAHAVTTPSSTSARLIPLARTSDSNFVDNPKDLYALEQLGDQEEALRILLPVFSPETKDENDENRSSHGGQDMGLAIQEPPHFGFENVTRMGGMSSSSSRMRDGIGPSRPRLRLKPRINTNRHQDDMKIDVMGQEIHYMSEFSMNTSRASSFPPRTQRPMGLVSGQPPQDSSLRPVHWMEMMGQNHQRGNNMDAPRLQRPIPRRPLYGNQNRY